MGLVRKITVQKNKAVRPIEIGLTAFAFSFQKNSDFFKENLSKNFYKMNGISLGFLKIGLFSYCNNVESARNLGYTTLMCFFQQTYLGGNKKRNFCRIKEELWLVLLNMWRWQFWENIGGDVNANTEWCGIPKA
ncbi:hypothetical protein J2T12_004055 [Paenibacillus anaericanus]|uniref:hypothetical protein n=1 Tax=Paenibacillus anaericanus TaxID=170367 RepID=UPI002789DB38|nr:hypothetical protein [Paenibacillus anaericanus]MDQ0090632.1 hypothetical protein [Paenibacillus anaericanus]